MAKPQLPDDFKDFLKLLNENEVRYLLIGGYAVAFYGYPRATQDMDIWIATDEANAEKMVDVMRGFGFGESDVSAATFLALDGVVRLDSASRPFGWKY